MEENEDIYRRLLILLVIIFSCKIIESDWLIARDPAVRIFPFGPRVRTATNNFPAFASFPAIFFHCKERKM